MSDRQTLASTRNAQATTGKQALAGRVVLITGASGGLGGALALDCAAAGASVILGGRKLSKLEQVYDQIIAAGGAQPALAPLDLATATARDYDALAETIGREFGRLDGLVHAAALLGDRTPIDQYDVPTWCQVLHVNLTAPFILTQVLLPLLRKSSNAVVLLASSGVVDNPRPHWGAYAVSKSGLVAFGAMLAQELQGNSRIRVESINPGAMRTAMRAAAYPAEDRNNLPKPEDVTQLFIDRLS
jgi:NAD(P)-dependent dehydrogenase (short-subunit alcohol dehydrogenase family)